MTFTIFQAGDAYIASKIMENYRHVNFGNTLIPVNSLGNGVDSTLDLGSSTYKWRDAWIGRNLNVAGTATFSGSVVATGLARAYVNFDGNIANLSSISFTYSGPIITATKTSHGLSTGFCVTFTGQTGNNSVLNGTWIITVTSANTFVFTIDSTPSGTLSSASTNSIIGIRNSFNAKVERTGTGFFKIWFLNSLSPVPVVCVTASGGDTTTTLNTVSSTFVIIYMTDSSPGEGVNPSTVCCAMF